MLKLAAMIGGVLLMGGVAFAGTRTLLDESTSPTIGSTVQAPVAGTTTRHDGRGREVEQRGRENEPGEDVRGPCDEAEHANDPRCTGATVPPQADDDVAEDRGSDDRGSNSGPSDRSGHDEGDDNSGRSGGGDDGGHSGHGRGGEDD